MRSSKDQIWNSRPRRARSCFTTRTGCSRTAIAGKRNSPPTSRPTRPIAEPGRREGENMLLQAIAFYVFAAGVGASGTMVVVSRNPVYSVLFLILAFFNAAALFLLIGAEFIAMILVIVYVGAVAVLFLFVVMMLDINVTELREGFLKSLPIGALIGVVLFAEILLGLGVLGGTPTS